MDVRRKWVAGTAVLCLVVLIAGWLALVKPQHAQAASLRAQTATEQTQTDSLRAQLGVLRSEQKTLPAQKAALAAARTQIPAAEDLPGLTVQLDAVAARTGVDLTTLTPAAAAAATTGSTGASSSTSGSTGAAVTGGVQQVGLAMTVTGSYPHLLAFFQALETMHRAILVDTFTVATGSGSASPTSTPGSGGGATAPGELTVTVNARAFFDAAASTS